MLKVVVFVCGAALMALELLAARVLAPFLGNSIFVWGAIISTVMVALSLGYWLGGQLADREGAARTLPLVIAGAGLLTVFAPLIAVAVLPSAAGLGPRLGSLVAATLIFFLPSLLLAMVSPIGVRLAATSGLEQLGRSTGGLYAISTAGSIVGTLLTSFWLIPALSLEPLIVAIGFALFATALAALALPQLRAERQALRPARGRGILGRAGLALALVSAGLVVGGWVLARVAVPPTVNEYGEQVLYRTDSQYHRISVTELDGARILRFDKSKQSAISLADGFTSTNRYPNYVDLALALKPDAKSLLVLGLGGGAISKRWWHDYPDMQVTSVEIDPAVIDVSRRFFGLPEDARLSVVNQDARRYVQTTQEKYDVVVVDCYYADSLPFHLTTQEFFREVKARMPPDGVLAYNVIGSVTGDDSRLFRSMYRTVGTQWRDLWVFPIGLAENRALSERRNIVVIATDTQLTHDELLRRVSSRVNGRVTVADFPAFTADLYDAQPPLGDVPLLTDQHAPIDSLTRVQ